MQKFINNYSQPITAAIAAAAQSVTTAFAVPGMSNGDVAVLTLSSTKGDIEIIRATKTAAGYDLIRAQENTTARDWPEGSTISMRITAALLADLSSPFAAGKNGLVPASGGGSANFLRADGQWVVPPAGPASVFESVVLKTTPDGVSDWNGGDRYDIAMDSIAATMVVIRPTGAVNHINLTLPLSSPIRRKRLQIYMDMNPDNPNALLTLNGFHYSNFWGSDYYSALLDIDCIVDQTKLLISGRSLPWFALVS